MRKAILWVVGWVVVLSLNLWFIIDAVARGSYWTSYIGSAAAVLMCLVFLLLRIVDLVKIVVGYKNWRRLFYRGQSPRKV
jgi:amino acid transporter